MNEIQIHGITNPFVITGIVLSVLWMGAYILSWIVQWSWAWVDEAEVGKSNWVVNLFKDSTKREGWYKVNKYYMYWKYSDGKKVGSADEFIVERMGYPLESSVPRAHIIDDDDIQMYFLLLPLIWFGVLCLNFWYISMWFAMAITLAFTLRMARRGAKLLSRHINDKSAHGAGDAHKS